MHVVRTTLVFLGMALCEIGGAYLIWLWIKENRSMWLGVAGACSLILYGMVATLQPSVFGRTYATYGGIFIAMSLLWAYKVDQFVPDKYDILGAAIAVLGVAIMFYAPRS